LHSSVSSSSTPAPQAGTKPAALALMGREAFSGSSFQARERTRMASKPLHTWGLRHSAPPHSMRDARPRRRRSAPSTSASVPVLHALELVVTWLPSASRPATRAETPLAITCSTAVLPRRRARPAS
jgi:hypothetical protein